MRKKPEDIIWDFFTPLVGWLFSRDGWFSFLFYVAFTGLWALLDHTLGDSWFVIAFMGYVLTQAFLHGAITLAARVKSGKWLGPRLHLALINLGVFVGLAILLTHFGGENPAALPAFIEFTLIAVGVCAYRYYRNYWQSRRYIAGEVKRFKNELGIGE